MAINRDIKTVLISKWTIPLFMVFLLTLTMSVRLLSDPDLGSHLKGGKWIVAHQSVPENDISTYTVSGNEYIDIHWFFQVLVFGVYSLGGYKALSLTVTLLALLLFILLFFRNLKERFHKSLTISMLLLAFLVIEPRIMLRPEMFTLLYLSLLLFILDQYFSDRENLLFLMPVIMLVWCNMQGLFVLGLIVIGVYYISQLLSEKKYDRKFTLYFIGSVLVCLVNPYFIRGFLFPIELFTRLEGENVFHQHIRELVSLTSLDTLVFKDILFIIYSFLAVFSVILTIRSRKPHEVILLILFLYLAVIAIRNIPLFVVLSFPVLCRSMNGIKEYLQGKGYKRFLSVTGIAVFWFCIILPILLIPRMITNAYYVANASYCKTGLGIDPWHQPVRGAEFLNKNELHGRIINSLAFGGWLSWSLPQAVFIDGRLEVIREPLYQEVVESWNGNLPGLLEKYRPELIIFNYLKYYPWTVQLLKMPGWKLIYLDGFTAIYALDGSPGSKMQLDLSKLAEIYIGQKEYTETRREEILQKQPSSGLIKWLKGFYTPVDNTADEILNMASFCLQTGFAEPAEKLFLSYIERTRGGNNTVFYALADIYRSWKLNDPARVCYKRILSFDPDNRIVINALNDLEKPEYINPSGSNTGTANSEAVRLFNQGNEFFRNNQTGKALEAYNKAISLNPGYLKALNNRGILKASSYGRFREAMADFNEVIRLDPANSDAYLGRGSCFFQLGEADSACKDWEKAYNLGNSRALALLEQHCGKQGKN